MKPADQEIFWEWLVWLAGIVIVLAVLVRLFI
jgi:hypothetical protein